MCIIRVITISAYMGLGLPLLLLNLLGAVVAGIWLIVLGQWHVLFVGLALLFSSDFILGILLAPGVLLVGWAESAAAPKGKGALAVFVVLGNLCNLSAVSLWCCGIFVLFNSSVPFESHILPLLIWSYAIAARPMQTMAREDDHPVSVLVALFAESALVVLMILQFSSPLAKGHVFLVFAAFMCLVLLIQLVMVTCSPPNFLKRSLP